MRKWDGKKDLHYLVSMRFLMNQFSQFQFII